MTVLSRETFFLIIILSCWLCYSNVIQIIRISGGPTENVGRVEVFLNGRWGTVCDDSWDITDAHVVCRLLGYPGAVRARSSAHLGEGSERIWLDNVACDESSVFSQACPKIDLGVSNCDHGEDAVVECFPFEAASTVTPGIANIRLAGGSTPNVGRVEVFVNGEWGTVCDDSWDIVDAAVVCRQLGYPGAVRARSSAHYGEGSGRIWLDNVACAESSLSLQDCPKSEIGDHNCNHKEDAGVECLPLEAPTTVAPGIANIRLAGGSTPNEGRVEVFVNGEWGTVCDDSWDIIDAAIVCRQLGYPGAVRARSSAHYGEGSGRIWLDNVACAESSLSLQDCPKSEIGVHNCNHKEDAGVECLPLEAPTTVAPSIANIRLAGGSTPNVGRVEVFVNGEWGTVCDDLWDIIDAAVVCRQLGYPGAVRVRSSAHYGEGSGRIWLDNVACAESSLSLQDCPKSEIGDHNCNHKEDAGVECLPLEAPTTGFPAVTPVRMATNVASRQLDFLKRPEDTELTLGDIGVFHCEVDDASAEVTWFKDDIQIAPGLANGLILLCDHSLMITDIEVHHHGTYKCVATSSGGRRAEVTARAYFPTSYVFDSQPGDVTVSNGKSSSDVFVQYCNASTELVEGRFALGLQSTHH
ncbi:neurotrypsin-like [Apostichopus japonicus]|uniref:neurotrypsin-like n=1 Tax=Stichopus japonicus TaxID=307972 RepID=UPI003AB7D27F